jgi:hypothetical protein
MGHHGKLVQQPDLILKSFLLLILNFEASFQFSSTKKPDTKVSGLL